tara:strand:- start:173 stop:457 length:285 start_codon:yes stop_codon:yes gene_type:complete
MPIKRYVKTNGGIDLSISNEIYKAIQNKSISFKKQITSSGDRLDHIAYKEYKNAQYWWIIASASGIGWWLQVPEGVVLNIPTNLEQVENLRENV